MDFKYVFVLIFLFYVIKSSSQESSWQWINPYPLPFFSSMQEGANGEIYLWNNYDELYRYKEDELIYIDTPKPYSFINFETDRFSDYTYIVNDSTWYCYKQVLGNFYTNDGGKNYTETEFVVNGFHSIQYALDKKHALSIAKGPGFSKKLLITENNGETWNEILQANSLLFPYWKGTDTIYVFANDTITYTFDKGLNWNKGIRCLQCSTIQLQDKELYVSSPFEKILLSEDYGQSFESIYQLEHIDSLGGNFGGTPYFKIEGKIGCAISSQRLYITEDKGVTFQAFDYLLPFNIDISSCTIFGKSVLLEASNIIKDIVKFDLESKTFKNNFSKGLFNLNNFHVVYDSIYVLTSHSNYGDRRDIHISYDRGYTWETKVLPQNEFLPLAQRKNYGVDFINNNCMLFTNDRMYIASFPYNNWTESFSPSDTATQSFQFFGENEGILLDLNNNVFKTKDQGESWEFVTQLNQVNSYVDVFSSKKSNTSFILQQPTWGINKSLLYIFQDGALQDFITLAEQRGNYHGGYIYNDSLLYLSFYNNTYKIDMSNNDFETLCYLNHGKVVHIDNDTMWVKNEGIMYKMNEMCQVISSDTFSYSRDVSTGNLNPLDLIELYVDENGEAFGYYPKGYMLKYTDNFRADLLVGIEETIFPKSIDEKKDIYLFPNPTNGNLQLNANLKNPTIFFYSTDGRRVGSFHENSFTLASDLRGLFFYTILEDGKYVSSGKVVVE